MRHSDMKGPQQGTRAAASSALSLKQRMEDLRICRYVRIHRGKYRSVVSKYSKNENVLYVLLFLVFRYIRAPGDLLERRHGE